MDVGNPSNMERLRAVFPELDQLRHAVTAYSVDDAAIRARIRDDYARYRQIWCPHTATAAEVYTRLPAAQRASSPWILVATAHPAKFREIVEPLVGSKLTVPLALQALFERSSKFSTIEPSLAALRGAMSS
jgi:threonine synthase